jgi:hypothetical protein
VRLAIPVLLLICCLTGCHKASQNNEAVRQGVLEYLAPKGMTPATMDITVTAAKFDGNQADATVAFAAKGNATAQMTMQYHLEMKDNKWAVVGKNDSGQHGAGAALPPAGGASADPANPHGGAMPGAASPNGAGGSMPSPQDLPPSGKKK